MNHEHVIRWSKICAFPTLIQQVGYVYLSSPCVVSDFSHDAYYSFKYKEYHNVKTKIYGLLKCTDKISNGIIVTKTNQVKNKNTIRTVRDANYSRYIINKLCMIIK